jgi:AcrR family transcriptional regulator
MAGRQGEPKGDKRERTRARLVEAAAQVIAEKGFEGSSLEQIARRAGMTRGAIYGNFRNRDELFLAVVETRWRPIMPRFEPGATYVDQMNALAKAVIEALPARKAAAVGAASFNVYALTHEPMRERLVQLNADIYRRMAQAIAASVPEQELPMRPDAFARVLHGLIEGLVALSNLTPELITPAVIRAAFQALARSRPA